MALIESIQLDWPLGPGPPAAGKVPAFFHFRGKSRVSGPNLVGAPIFIDESGDFGSNSDYYLMALVFHDQSVAIESQLARLSSAL